jgi:hypothetical protein
VKEVGKMNQQLLTKKLQKLQKNHLWRAFSHILFLFLSFAAIYLIILFLLIFKVIRVNNQSYVLLILSLAIILVFVITSFIVYPLQLKKENQRFAKAYDVLIDQVMNVDHLNWHNYKIVGDDPLISPLNYSLKGRWYEAEFVIENRNGRIAINHFENKNQLIVISTILKSWPNFFYQLRGDRFHQPRRWANGEKSIVQRSSIRIGERDYLQFTSRDLITDWSDARRDELFKPILYRLQYLEACPIITLDESRNYSLSFSDWNFHFAPSIQVPITSEIIKASMDDRNNLVMAIREWIRTINLIDNGK